MSAPDHQAEKGDDRDAAPIAADQGYDVAVRTPSGHLQRIDGALAEVEPDHVGAGLDPPPARLVHDAPDLAQAPAQLPARVVRHVPQQLAEIAPPDRARRHGQVGKESTGLPRARQHHRHAVPDNRQRPQQPQPKTAAGARRWNDANVLVMSLRLTSPEVAREMLEAWFATAADPGEAANIARLEGPDR